MMNKKNYPPNEVKKRINKFIDNMQKKLDDNDDLFWAVSNNDRMIMDQALERQIETEVYTKTIDSLAFYKYKYFCPYCGKELEYKEGKFCKYCGQKVSFPPRKAKVTHIDR